MDMSFVVRCEYQVRISISQMSLKEGIQSQLHCTTDKNHNLASEISQLSADLKSASRNIFHLRESLKKANDVADPLQKENNALKVNLDESGR